MKTLQGAACTNHPHLETLFFPNNPNPNHAHLAATRKICDNCPINTDCLHEALRLGNKAQGIWAGTTEQQRRHMKKRDRKPA